MWSERAPIKITNYLSGLSLADAASQTEDPSTFGELTVNVPGHATSHQIIEYTVGINYYDTPWSAGEQLYFRKSICI